MQEAQGTIGPSGPFTYYHPDTLTSLNLPEWALLELATSAGRLQLVTGLSNDLVDATLLDQ